jgi:cyclase
LLKKRIIPLQTLVSGRLVKTRQFDNWRDVGDPVKSSAVYNSQSADELIFLDITRGNRTTERLQRTLTEVSKVCFMPLTAGGGISTLEQASELILSGADKVIINSAVYPDKSLIEKIAGKFGAQSVVVSIDVSFDRTAEDYVLRSHSGSQVESVGLEEHIDAVVAAGAGEIMVQSIDNDGMMGGFDLKLADRAAKASNVPLILAGGSGNYHHLKDAFESADVSAVACGSLFNFSDSNPLRAKAFLTNHGLHFKVV